MGAQPLIVSLYAQGVAVSGAKVYSYVKDTTTAQAIYTDSGLTTPAANPSVSDSEGRVALYLNDALSYSIVIKAADDSYTFFAADYEAGANGFAVVQTEPISAGDQADIATVAGAIDDGTLAALVDPSTYLLKANNLNDIASASTARGNIAAYGSGDNVTFGTVTVTGDVNIDSGTLFVDVSEDTVGVGTPSALGKLHVLTGDTTGTVNADADELVVEGSGHSGITILSGATSRGGLHFGDSGSDSAGYVKYNHNTDQITLGANGADRAYLTSVGSFFCPGIYTYTTSGAANVNVSSNGQTRRSTSAAKYKINRENIGPEYVQRFFDICAQDDTLVWYRSDPDKTVDPGEHSYYGMIADRFVKDMPQLCSFGAPDENGNVEVEGFAYERTAPFLIARILELTARLEALEGANQ